jgi:hypothetical protein
VIKKNQSSKKEYGSAVLHWYLLLKPKLQTTMVLPVIFLPLKLKLQTTMVLPVIFLLLKLKLQTTMVLPAIVQQQSTRRS